MALVKCRDLHWAMMAHKDQKDTNLSSIRMLIVADGANPCESTLISFIFPLFKLFFKFLNIKGPFGCFAYGQGLCHRVMPS